MTTHPDTEVLASGPRLVYAAGVTAQDPLHVVVIPLRQISQGSPGSPDVGVTQLLVEIRGDQPGRLVADLTELGVSAIDLILRYPSTAIVHEPVASAEAKRKASRENVFQDRDFDRSFGLDGIIIPCVKSKKGIGFTGWLASHDSYDAG